MNQIITSFLRKSREYQNYYYQHYGIFYDIRDIMLHLMTHELHNIPKEYENEAKRRVESISQYFEASGTTEK